MNNDTLISKEQLLIEMERKCNRKCSTCDYSTFLATNERCGLIAEQPTIYTLEKIKEMEEHIEELEILTGLMRYYNKFVEEIFQKEKGSNLIYPDFDEIYKRYFDLLAENERLAKALKEAMSHIRGGHLFLQKMGVENELE